MRKNFPLFFVFVFVISLIPGLLAAQENNGQPDRYQDWIKRCSADPTFADRCYISQDLTLKETGQHIFTIAVGYPLDAPEPLMMVTAPLGIYLPAGIVIKVDDLDQHRIVLAYCNDEGCHGYFRFTGELLTQFRNGRWLEVVFQNTARRPHHFNVSLNGFTASLASLKTR